MENSEQKAQLVAMPLELLNSILVYLGKRPYEEVAAFFEGVKTEVKSIQEPDPAEQGVQETPVEPPTAPKPRAPRKKVEAEAPSAPINTL